MSKKIQGFNIGSRSAPASQPSVNYTSHLGDAFKKALFETFVVGDGEPNIGPPPVQVIHGDVTYPIDALHTAQDYEIIDGVVRAPVRIGGKLTIKRTFKDGAIAQTASGIRADDGDHITISASEIEVDQMLARQDGNLKDRVSVTGGVTLQSKGAIKPVSYNDRKSHLKIGEGAIVECSALEAFGLTGATVKAKACNITSDVEGSKILAGSIVMQGKNPIRVRNSVVIGRDVVTLLSVFGSNSAFLSYGKLNAPRLMGYVFTSDEEKHHATAEPCLFASLDDIEIPDLALTQVHAYGYINGSAYPSSRQAQWQCSTDPGLVKSIILQKAKEHGVSREDIQAMWPDLKVEPAL